MDFSDDLLLRCQCGEYTFLNIGKLAWGTDDIEYEIWISRHPRTWRERLKEAWKAIHGREFDTSNVVLIGQAKAQEIAAALKSTSTNNDTPPKGTPVDFKHRL